MSELETQTKKCGFCGEIIPAEASRCSYCGSLLGAEGGVNTNEPVKVNIRPTTGEENDRYLTVPPYKPAAGRLSNGAKVFLTVVTSILPGLGQLIGIIAAIIFLNSDDDEDRRSFGAALLIAAITVFVIVCLACMVLVIIAAAFQSY